MGSFSSRIFAAVASAALLASTALPAVPVTSALAAETSLTSGIDGGFPMIPLTFVKDGITLRYLSLITTVGTPQAVAAEELRLESMVPADDKTERRHIDFMSAYSRTVEPSFSG